MIKENLKTALLLMLALTSMLLVLSEPKEEIWYEAFIISKGLGAAAGYLCYYLIRYKKWYEVKEDGYDQKK